MSRPILYDYWRSSAAYRVRIALNLKGAKFDRHIEFVGEDGKTRVRSRTDWAIIDKVSGRPIRIPPEVVAPFTGAG